MQCLDCGYSTEKMSSWKSHLKSKRHRAITGHACICEKIYASKATLRRHEKTCDLIHKKNDHTSALTAVVDRLAQEIAETNARAAVEKLILLQDQIERDRKLAKEQRRIARRQAERDAHHAAEIERLLQEMAARPQMVMNNCTFNLATFLNETCKHAPSIEQFMGTIPFCLDSEKPIGQYIVDQLAKCSVEERPIHCTDLKRCKLAVKQQNEWVQDATKIDPLMQQHITALRLRCLKHLNEVWCLDNPKYEDPDSKQNDEYHQFIMNIMGDLDAKFLNHVAKVTPIPKP